MTASRPPLRPEDLLARSPRAPRVLPPLESPDPVALFDADGRLIQANEAAHDAGAPAPAPADPPPAAMPPFWGDVEGRKRLLHGVAQPGGAHNLEVRLKVRGGSTELVYWVTARAFPASGPGRFVASAHDVTEKNAEHELLKMCYDDLASRADRDPVTGLFTREHFRLLLDHEIEKAKRTGRPLALLHFGLDDFKTVNDTHGLAAGDEYLLRLGDELRGALHRDELIGRVGGDEIAIVFPDTTGTRAAEEAERLGVLISRLSATYEGSTIALTASAGAAFFPDHAEQASELLQAADLAMHQAKRKGRSLFRIHDPQDRERDRIGTLRAQAERIKTGLAEARFVPVFQPVADINTGRIVSVETLARLKDATGRLVSPAEFIDAAERFGFMTAIDRLVIAGAFDALVASRGRSLPDLEMAINLSGHDFDDDSLVADISRMARNKGIRPERITFEITETAALKDLHRVQNFTRALTAEGFRFALDDFGIGFSSFKYLRELPVSSLKFDLSYIQNLPSQIENRVFVRGIAEICRGLGVKTVAEGVESATILSILKELGVERAQGHYIGYPSPDLPRAKGEPSSGVMKRLER